MMLRQFLKDSAIYGISTILARGIIVLMLPLYTRVLSPADIGLLDLLLILTNLANLTIALEISQGLARYFPEARSEQEQVDFASTSLWFTLAGYTGFTLLVLAQADQIAYWLLESPTRHGLVQVGALAIWANGLLYLVQGQLRWALRPLLYSITNLTFTLVSVGSTLLLLLVLHSGVIGAFYGQLAGSLAGAGLGLYFTRHYFRLRFNRARCAQMLRFSLPLVPSSISVFVTLYINRIAIKELMSISDLGLFGVAYRIAALTGLVMVGFQGALTPLVYTYYHRPETPAELARIFRYFLAFALIVVVGLAIFAREVTLLLATPEYVAAASVVPLLVPALLLSQMYIFTPGLSIAKKTGLLAGINVLGALLSTLLNLLLIPALGLPGAGLATLLSSAAIFGAYMLASQRYYFVAHSWARYGLAVLGALGIMLLATQLHATFWVAALVKMLLLATAGLFFVLLRLVEPVEVRYALSRLRLLPRA